MLLYSVTLDATPGPDADPPQPANTKPSHASCWVLAEDPDAALRTLTTALLDGHWIPGRIHAIRTIDPAAVPESDQARQYITEAIETGCTIVINTIEDDAADDDDQHADDEDSADDDDDQAHGEHPDPDEPAPDA